MANDIVRDPEGSAVDQHREPAASTSLASWVMTRVRSWEDYRTTNFDDKWDEYYRLWRGIWLESDKSRDSERSRLIHPALSQAIEATTSEIEEATFGNGRWFDVSDDAADEDKMGLEMWRDQLAEDFTKEDVESAMSEIFLNGALYGTGIGKIVLKEVEERTLGVNPIGDSDVTEPVVEVYGTVRPSLVAVHPKEFVIDPSARTIDEALGMAHITEVPKHEVERKQTNGTYFKMPIGSFTDSLVSADKGEGRGEYKDIREEDRTLLIEYHGFVPKYLIEGVAAEVAGDAGDAEVIISDDETQLVEAIVTIANGGQLLRAVENPYLMGDRCFMAYQHDRVPNRFWGRGVAEKGYNPQKGLDAEMRGRIDAMALSIHPMMAMDATRLHRGADLRVAPGRNILTNGNPRDILMPFNFGQVNPTTFSQSADLERQVQVGTGAMDSATPVGDNRRNETSGGMSMIMGGSVKRTKRTLANIERRLIRPFIHKASWRCMQFAPDRYPAQDIKFNVHSTLGIVAREMEQQQLAGMMNTVPAESPAFWMLLKSYYENSDMSNREDMLEIIEQMMQQSLQQQASPQPDPMIQIKREELQLKAQLEQAKLAQKADNDNKELALEVQRLQLELAKLELTRDEMILDGKIALAGQEQDSIVTAMQMGQKERSDMRAALAKIKGGKN